MKSDSTELFLFRLALVTPHVCWLGFVTSILWRWFVMPLGAPPIGIAHAIGLCLLVRYLVVHHRVEKLSDDDTIRAAAGDFFRSLALGCLALLIGWVLTWWLP